MLYKSVLATPGKVEDAARYLTERRGIRIGGESLRLKLREVEGARISGEMFEMLVEWMQDKNQPQALDAVHALNARFGLVAAPLNAGQGSEDISALVNAALAVSSHAGRFAEEIRKAVGDGVIEQHEVDTIERAARESQRQIEAAVLTARALAADPRSRAD
ncbi:phage regulatory CII family protein [Burkholderia plantarii]|uniref:phage regulatory CII family protein n=1 Tax=Burkholderia plantarii TaxID=41899 RepID=UPI00272B0AFF|nr:phage regulatory CII family protein [Burkholderia plantarii]